jgi:hypothetical protein
MIDNLVMECIQKHEGGEKFFDALDDLLRNAELLIKTLGNIAKSFKPECGFSKKNIQIIVSGKFGVSFEKYYGSCFVVNGNLRPDNNYVDDVFDKRFKEWNESQGTCAWVFIDDSYFLGRTANKIQDFVERNGGDFLGIVVAYDGSKEVKRYDLKCLYRYYDKIGGDNGKSD